MAASVSNSVDTAKFNPAAFFVTGSFRAGLGRQVRTGDTQHDL
jgi:hypothetical protein